MLRIRSFQGLRPADHLAHQVASVPYDVVSTAEARELAADNPYSLLHVERAEIDLPDGTDIYSDAVYARAAENFMRLQEENVLIREPRPCFYLYRQKTDFHTQRGIAAVCHIEDYENDIIKKHETTRRDKEDDRTRLIHELGADTSPVFLTYRDDAAIDSLVAGIESCAPLNHFVAPDGIEHAVWRIDGGAELVKAFSSIPVAYVADGHHRTASAVRVGQERRSANPNQTGDEDYNWFLAVLFPASQLKIMAYNRLVLDLNGLREDEFLRQVGEVFEISGGADPHPRAAGHISMYLEGKWHGLTWSPEAAASPIDQLDVSKLQDRLLGPILGIDDPRTSRCIQFVGGIRGASALTAAVDSGRAAVAFSMSPTTVEQLMSIADAGQIMPPKSTWFEPKLRSGLFIHTIG